VNRKKGSRAAVVPNSKTLGRREDKKVGVVISKHPLHKARDKGGRGKETEDSTADRFGFRPAESVRTRLKEGKRRKWMVTDDVSAIHRGKRRVRTGGGEVTKVRGKTNCGWLRGKADVLRRDDYRSASE